MNAPSPSNSNRRIHHEYERELKGNSNDQRRQSPGRNDHTTLHGPLPSTSYARPHSYNSEYHQTTNISPGSSRSTSAASYQAMLKNHPRPTDRRSSADGAVSRTKDDHRGYPYSGNEYQYAKTEGNERNRNQERKHDEPTENRMDKRRKEGNDDSNSYKKNPFQSDSNQFDTRVTPTNCQSTRNREPAYTRTFKQEGSRDNALDRERSPVSAKSSQGRRHSTERGGITNNRSDSINNIQSINEGERRSPLISQKEAFKKQQEVRVSRQDGDRKGKKNSEDERHNCKFKEPYHEQNRRQRMENSLDQHRNSKRPTTPPQRQKDESLPSSRDRQANYDNSNNQKRSPDQRDPRRHSEDGQTRSAQRSIREKPFQSNREHSSSKVSPKHEVESTKNYIRPKPIQGDKTCHDTYQSRESKQGRTNDKYKEDNDQNRDKQHDKEPDKNADYRSQEDTRGTKRKCSDEGDEYSQCNKKGKYQPGVQRKGRKASISSPRVGPKGSTSQEYKSVSTHDNSSSKDSDIDSLSSSETKRVSALARLGPKVTLNQRLSKLPKQKVDCKEHSINTSKDLIRNNEGTEDTHLSPEDNILTQKQDNR